MKEGKEEEEDNDGDNVDDDDEHMIQCRRCIVHDAE